MKLFNPLRIKIHNLILSLKSVVKRKPREPVFINPYMTEYGSRDTRNKKQQKTAFKVPSVHFSFPIIKEMKEVIKGDLMWVWYKTKAGKQYLDGRKLKREEYDRAVELMVGKRT